MRGEPNYHLNVGQEKGLCKRGKIITSMKPNVINKGVQVNAAKKTDVDNLLKKHFGCNWKNLPDLEYFKTVMDDEKNNEQDHESDFGDKMKKKKNFLNKKFYCVSYIICIFFFTFKIFFKFKSCVFLRCLYLKSL